MPAISRLEILLLCRRFFEVYGRSAGREARRRRDRLLGGDDFEGYLVWSRVVSTMDGLAEEGAAGAPIDTYN